MSLKPTLIEIFRITSLSNKNAYMYFYTMYFYYTIILNGNIAKEHIFMMLNILYSDGKHFSMIRHTCIDVIMML